MCESLNPWYYSSLNVLAVSLSKSDLVCPNCLCIISPHLPPFVAAFFQQLSALDATIEYASIKSKELQFYGIPIPKPVLFDVRSFSSTKESPKSLKTMWHRWMVYNYPGSHSHLWSLRFLKRLLSLRFLAPCLIYFYALAAGLG